MYNKSTIILPNCDNRDKEETSFESISNDFVNRLEKYLINKSDISNIEERKSIIYEIKKLKERAYYCYNQLTENEKENVSEEKEIFDTWCKKFHISRLYKISIIIPAYNVEKYLPECLDSILKQSITDYEILIIDDGSTDCTKEIAKRYQQEHKESIWIYEQNNMGPSGARNRGLEEAAGEYILYIDSDDFIETDMLEQLIKKTEKYDLDVLLFACRKIIMQGEKVVGQEHWGYEQIDTSGRPGIKVMAELLPDAKLYDVVWLQFVKKNVIDENNIRFYPGIIHEDHLYTFTVLLNSKKCGYISDELYYYRIRAHSIMTTEGRDMERFVGWAITLRELVRLYNEENIHNTFPDCDQAIRDYIWYCEKFALSMKQKLITYKNAEEYQESVRTLKQAMKEFNGLQEYKKLVKTKLCLKLGVLKNKIEANIWKLLKAIKRKCI